jgi:hypothetical protein
MPQYSSPIININEMQRMYINLLKREYKEILNIHMTELMVLNYAHHVRNNDTYILRRDSHNVEHNQKIKQVSVFYMSKTNLYSRPTDPTSYRFANIVAYKISDYPEVATEFGFEQDDDYCIRILYDYTSVRVSLFHD